MGKVFRTAVFGGFKKKEVIDYLESLSQEKKVSDAMAAEDTLMLEKQISDLKVQLRAAEEREVSRRQELEEARAQGIAEVQGLAGQIEALKRQMAEDREGLDATLSEQAALRMTIEQLRDEKTLLIQEKAALNDEKNQLNSRILDFDDERRLFDAERQRLEREMAEQRKELENRIFDLEAEVLESLEQVRMRPPQPYPAAAPTAERPAPQAAEVAQPEPLEAGLPVPETEYRPQGHKRTNGRVLVRRPDSAQVQQKPSAGDEVKAEAEASKLASVRDILRYVRKR